MLCILAVELSPMTHVSPHQLSQQAGTSLTKAGQPVGCGQMLASVANWLKRSTGQNCHR